MKIFIASEFRCHIFEGEYYLSRRAYTIYKRYAQAFGRIVLCSRFVEIDKMEPDLYRADFIEETVHIDSLLKTLIGIENQIIQNRMKDCSLVICRMPSIIAYKASDIAKKLNKPILSELMCDGWDPYWNHGFTGKVIAGYMHLKMKSVTENSNYAVYVTEKYLQNRYPCNNASINASNVQIKELDSTILQKRIDKIAASDLKHELSLMTTATIDLESKGQRFVVEAMGELKKNGIRVIYYLAGDGNRDYLLEIAKKNDVENQIVFLGVLTLEQVYQQIDNVDIYIQPSLQEGLPRAVIEAMSRACPCLGARTAGIPELLDDECIFERSSSHSIALAIKRMIDSDLESYARTNFEHCKEYIEDRLNQRRNEYFSKICNDLRRLE